LIGLGNFFSARAALVWGFVVLVPLLLAGCSPAPPASDVESGARKVVVFDGGGVTEGEVQDGVERLNAASTAASGGSKQDIQPGSPQFEAAKRQVVPQLLAFNLAGAYAQENSIEVSEGEVQGEIDQTKQQLAQQAEAAGKGGDPDAVFQEALDRFGFTEASFRDEVRKGLLVQKVQDEVAGDAAPTEQEVQDFYDNNTDQFTMPERRCIRHILFSPDDEATADEVKSELDNGGDFAELAQEYSGDPGSKDKGGDVGCQAKGAFVPEFDDAAFGAKEGEIVGPVKTDFGYHVIQVTEIQPEEQQPLEEVAPQIEEQLSRQRQATEFDSWIQDQLDERNVKYLPGYDPNQQPLPGGPGGAVPQGGAPGEEAPGAPAPQGAPGG
jgi:parvulin-like peptidyl-prolyl isomerase